ncbi:MAG: hypothetical protein ABI016_16960 [Chthoniobacterales bacterium]
MLNPSRGRTIALYFFASGWVASAAAFLLPGLSEGNWVRTGLFIYGLSAIIFGGGTALFRHFDVRAKEALARGEGIIARWRVEAEAWHEFVALDRQWNEGGETLPNELSRPEIVPADGVEVIVGKDAIQIGESIHRLTGGMPEVTAATLVESRPAVIDLQLYYPGGGYGASGVPHSARRAALRFPVGQNAGNEAGAVVAHYRGDTPREASFYHGKGDGTNLEDLTKCYNCGFETHKLMSHCPQCGTSMQSKRWSRRYGVMLFGLGLAISLVIGFVLLATASMLLHPGASSGGSRFSGTAEQGRLFLGILGTVELFGITAMCYGLWQIVTGRRSKWVIYFVVGLAAVLFLVALLI